MVLERITYDYHRLSVIVYNQELDFLVMGHYYTCCIHIRLPLCVSETLLFATATMLL